MLQLVDYTMCASNLNYRRYYVESAAVSSLNCSRCSISVCTVLSVSLPPSPATADHPLPTRACSYRQMLHLHAKLSTQNTVFFSTKCWAPPLPPQQWHLV